jgi:hypothetical protein
MSTILKALRRLEEDRNAGPGRPLREAVASGGTGERKRHGSWLLASALGLGVGLAASGGAYWFVTEQDAAESGAPVVIAPGLEPLPPVAVASESSPAVVEAGEAVPSSSSNEASDSGTPSAVVAAVPPKRRQALSPAALTSSVERIERPLPEPRISATEQDGEPLLLGSANRTQPRSRLGSERPSSRTAAATSRNLQAARSAVPPQVAPAPSDVDPWDQAVTEDPSKRDEVAPVVAVTPDKATLSWEKPTPNPVVQPGPAAMPVAEPQSTPPAAEPESVVAEKRGSARKAEKSPAPSGATTLTRAAVPGVSVEKTFWHPSAERRTALIKVDGGVEEIQEGDAVGPLVVSTIEPSGVVFQHDGIEIRRRVGE